MAITVSAGAAAGSPFGAGACPAGSTRGAEEPAIITTIFKFGDLLKTRIS